MYCQCEIRTDNHLTHKIVSPEAYNAKRCNAQATRKLVTSSGVFYCCSECSKVYTKDGFVLKNEPIDFNK